MRSYTDLALDLDAITSQSSLLVVVGVLKLKAFAWPGKMSHFCNRSRIL